MIPRATYRIQFRKDFTFTDAAALVPYLSDLGVTHLYSSPILKARSGSVHGYDVVDHSRINPELGGEEEFRSLVKTLRTYDIGVILDIVPNHMAVGGADNPCWLDLLEKGRASVFADLFDIDWESAQPGLRDKVLVPMLGVTPLEAVGAGELTLVRDDRLGKVAFAYGEHRFPLRQEDYPRVEADWESSNTPETLIQLLELQNFRLAYWREAGKRINWRRFFDVTELAALRVEDDGNFELTHATTLRLYGEGLIDGVRVDHIDGLADPQSYLTRLRARLEALNVQRERKDPPYIVVEKILAEDEGLPVEWAVEGTTGYDFMDQISALQHNGANALRFAEMWHKISGRPGDFETEERAARREILEKAFASQLRETVSAFQALLPALDSKALESALASLLEHLRAYRTYAGVPSAAFGRALAAAKAERKGGRGQEGEELDAVAGIMKAGDGSAPAVLDAVRRFNQLAAPVAAKAVEDTASYRYGRLLSRNDVGFSPGRFEMTPEEFLKKMSERFSAFPHGMLTTATHDHKRGADVRARLAALSDIPDAWEAEVGEWFAINRSMRTAKIRPGDEYQLYQTLLGAWPVESDRALAWRLKSLREAKLETSWLTPDEAFEKENLDFVRAILDPSHGFLARITAFSERLDPAGACNALVQCALHATTPGIPDYYQGTELWDLTLVDPDNRQPVDFSAHAAFMPRKLSLKDWKSGAPKLALIRTLLRLRKELPEAFLAPIEAVKSPEGVFAFRRGPLLVAVPLHATKDCMESGRPLPKVSGLLGAEGHWVNALDSSCGPVPSLNCEVLFADFPVVVLIQSSVLPQTSG